MADQLGRGPANTVELFDDQGDGTHARVIDIVVAGALAATDVIGKGPANALIRFEDQGDGTHARVVQFAS